MVINLDRAVRRIQMSPVGGDIELMSLTLDGPGEPVEIRFWSEEDDGRFLPPVMANLAPPRSDDIIVSRSNIIESVIDDLCRYVSSRQVGAETVSVRMDLTDSDIPGLGPIRDWDIIGRHIEHIDGMTVATFMVA